MKTIPNNMVVNTVKPQQTVTLFHKEALEIYNSMPQGTKELAAKKYDCARWYFKALLKDPKTKQSTIVLLVNAIAKACKEHRIKIVESDKQIQKMVKSFNSKYALLNS